MQVLFAFRDAITVLLEIRPFPPMPRVEQLVHPVGHLHGEHFEAVAEGHVVHRSLVIIPSLLRFRASHPEGP